MKKQEEMTPTELANMTVVYSIPAVEAVTARRDLPYRTSESGSLTFDVYDPPGRSPHERRPAVLIVFGYSDAGFPKVFGRRFKDMGQTVSWAKLIAASGMVAILYSNREPIEDLQSLLQYIRDDAATLGIDPNRLGVWAASSHVPLALSLLMETERRLACAVLCYGYMLDLQGATSVADAHKTYPFANPCAGKSMTDVRDDVPLLLVRAGTDQFGVNESVDSFAGGALQRNLPVTLVNHATAPHAFDLFDEGQVTREIIREILRFLQFHLSVDSGGE
jgi:dienelactone hydrolase